MSSDISWLPNSLFKDIKSPIVLYEPYSNQSYSGYYTHGTNKLTIVEHYEDTIASTISHELCHYIQYMEGRINPKGSSFEIVGTYEESIRTYFRTQKDEMEALLFEYKYAKNWCNDWWLNKLVWD